MAKKKQKTLIALVLDRSSSMGHLAKPALSLHNQTLDTIRNRSKAEKQDAYVSIIGFDNQARVEVHPTDAHRIDPATDYPVGGSTALFDAVWLAVETLKNAPGAKDENTAFLVVVVTDGEENVSFKSALSVRNLIADLQATDRWTLAFNLPRGYRDGFVRQFDIPADNCREWEQNTEGVRETSRVTTQSMGTYFTARSAGQTSSKSFYEDVTTDLSKVTAKKLKTLDDISDRFKIYTVGPEQPVKEFVEAKTGRDYVIGSTFYQLMKPEKVQPTKSVLIMEKGKKAIWGGNEARELIGLPTDGKTHARVEPGNHANHDVFVESRSVNRKLPRGTKVLVDIKKKVGSCPTWDHTAVAATA